MPTAPSPLWLPMISTLPPSTDPRSRSWKWIHLPHPRRLAASMLPRLSSTNRHLDGSVTLACLRAWCGVKNSQLFDSDGRMGDNIHCDRTLGQACTRNLGLYNHSIRGHLFGLPDLICEVHAAHATNAENDQGAYFYRRNGRTHRVVSVSQRPYLTFLAIDIFKQFTQCRIWPYHIL